MATFTAGLLGSFSRIFNFPPSTLPSSQSEPDVAAERTAAGSSYPRPASSASTRARPHSAIEGYWSYEGPSSGVILHQEGRDLGLKGLADVKITHASPSPVFAACQLPPLPRARIPYTATDVWSITADNAIAPTPDSSFDISLISDTSTDADDESNSSFTLPPPSAPPIGLGISGLFKPDGSPFDGMGVVSFGCGTAGSRSGRTAGGLSRVFLEEAAWTWAADPHHRMLTIIHEQEGEEELVIEEESQVWADVEQRSASRKSKSKTKKASVTRPVARTRDLSTVETISSGLKRLNANAHPQNVNAHPQNANAHPNTSTSPSRTVPSPRSPSVASRSRRTVQAQPVWRM
ncbi:hypothetical protein B0H14DRAFT_2697983 [Mycena olivaceomarginata]|nr:hypothetical protein B0H14DRAFT_2697983 [Mycena olivaceomarginata]